jgi:hypothetical protein
MVEAATLDTPELAYLLVRLEQGVEQTAAGFRHGMTVISVLFFFMAGGFAAFRSFGVAAFIAAFGVFIVWVGKRASARTSPEKMKPVVEAVRTAPERVKIVEHYQTSDSGRMFVTDWLVVATGEHRLLMKAKGDWQRLYAALQKRCPSATFMNR